MLPKVLQNMLDTLMLDNTIASWNIRGDDDITHVNIRFSGKMAGDQQNITYRKAPPSRVARDRSRLNENKSNDRQSRYERNTRADMDSDNKELFILPQQERKPREPAANTEVSSRGSTSGKATPNPQPILKAPPVATSPMPAKSSKEDNVNSKGCKQGENVNQLSGQAYEDKSDACHWCNVVFEDVKSLDHQRSCLSMH